MTGATARGRLGDGAGLGPKSRSAAAPGRRASSRRALSRWPWAAILTGTGALAAWEGGARALGTPAYILPPPSRVALTLVAQAPLLWRDALTTRAEMLGGLLLGTLSGIAVALVMAQSRRLEQALGPLLVVAQALPVFAIAPLLVVWFGFGVASKLAMAGLIIFFPVSTSLFEGLRRTDEGLIDLARLNRASRRDTLLLVRLPAALPALGRGPQSRGRGGAARRRGGRMGGLLVGARPRHAARQRPDADRYGLRRPHDPGRVLARPLGRGRRADASPRVLGARHARRPSPPRRPLMRSLALAATLLLGLVAGSALPARAADTTPAPAAPPSTASAPQKVTLLLDWFVNPVHAAIVVAREKGFFAKQGLDVSFVEPADPSMPPRLVAAGQGDIALTYQPNFYLDVAAGLPVQRIGT